MSVTSMETMFRPWLQENPDKLQQPKPAHSGSHRSVRSKQMYEHQDLQPLDMTKSSLGLQLDGANDSREMKSEGSPSDTSIQSEADGSLSSSLQPKITDKKKVRDASELAANDHSYAIPPIENAEETPSSYSDDYWQSSIGTTPSEASNPPSGMMVSSGSPTSPTSTGSTVDAFDDYYNESYEEYQPEGYRNITTSVSQSSSGSEVLLPLESLMQSENDSPGENTSASQVPSSTTEISENAASSHNDLQNEGKETVQSSEGSQSDDKHGAINKDLENECKDAIAECDRLLQSVEGSHLDMSTLSALSGGSRNTTTDIMGASTDITSTGDERNQGDTAKGSVEETRSGAMSTINLDDLLRDNNYEVFTRGVTGSSTPVQSIGDDESTLPYSDEEDRRKKCAREPSSDEELKLNGRKKQRKFKKASKKSDIKSSRNRASNKRSPKGSPSSPKGHAARDDRTSDDSSSSGDNDQPRERPIQRSPIRGWRRARIGKAAKDRVRGIAMRVMPSLYGLSPKKKPAPKTTRRKYTASCKEDFFGKIMKDDDNDGTGSMQSVQAVNREEDQSEEIHQISSMDEDNSGEEHIVKSQESAAPSTDVYSFREEHEELEVEEASSGEGDKDEEQQEGQEEERISANLGSSLSFHNPELSRSLGPINNPYRSTGWVKTRCGESPLGPDQLPDLVTEDDDQDSNPPGPMWGDVRPDGDDDIEMFQDMPEDKDLDDSDMEEGQDRFGLCS